MSLEDNGSKKSVGMCRKEYEIIYKQLPVLLEKMDILFPTGNKTESSEPESKSEIKKKKVAAPLPAVTPEEIGEGYKDLEESTREFIKELDEAEKETDEGTTARARRQQRRHLLQWKTSSNNQELHSTKEEAVDLQEAGSSLVSFNFYHSCFSVD